MTYIISFEQLVDGNWTEQSKTYGLITEAKTQAEFMANKGTEFRNVIILDANRDTVDPVSQRASRDQMLRNATRDLKVLERVIDYDGDGYDDEDILIRVSKDTALSMSEGTSITLSDYREKVESLCQSEYEVTFTYSLTVTKVVTATSEDHALELVEDEDPVRIDVEYGWEEGDLYCEDRSADLY